MKDCFCRVYSRIHDWCIYEVHTVRALKFQPWMVSSGFRFQDCVYLRCNENGLAFLFMCVEEKKFTAQGKEAQLGAGAPRTGEGISDLYTPSTQDISMMIEKDYMSISRNTNTFDV